jgi:LysM repeat protein
MKIGSAVLGLHIAALIAFSLTQGCITTESQGSGRGAGAKHKGPWKHEHSGKDSSDQAVADDSIYQGDDQGSMYDPVMIDSGTENTMPEPYVEPVPTYGNTDTYVVQKGDVLSRLAVDFNTTTKTLIAMNNLSNPDVLYVGQELRVPAGSKRSASPSTSKPSIKKGGTYVIQKGDTLSGIAVAAGVSLGDLRSLNNIEGDRIIAGETLDIPSGGKVPTNTQKSTAKKADPVEPEPAPVAGPDDENQTETTDLQVDTVMDHLVYPGETLDDIARQYSVSKSDIMRMNMNNLSSESDLKEGQRLRIPISE